MYGHSHFDNTEHFFPSAFIPFSSQIVQISSTNYSIIKKKDSFNG